MFESIIRNFETAFLILLINLNFWGLNLKEIPQNQVIRVIDGDTFEIYLNNKIEKIRMIGLNTPESVDPNRGIECYGIEASDRLKELLHGKIVNLESDETQDYVDKFGRVLKYVYLDKKNINKQMIEEGFGFEYTFKKPYKYQIEFREAQKKAKQNSLGLWKNENCQY